MSSLADMQGTSMRFNLPPIMVVSKNDCNDSLDESLHIYLMTGRSTN